MFIVKYRRICFIISGLFAALSLFAIFNFGIKTGIDFSGGSLLEFSYSNSELSQEDIESKISNIDLGQYVLRETGENGFILKTKILNDAEKQNLVSNLQFENTTFEEKRFNTIGPTLGQELKTKTLTALIVLLITTILFIAYAFRHVSNPVSSWKYGIIAIITLIFDVLITVGFFALLGHLYGVEVDTLFVTAILVILGYSINDTIIIMDRIRENLKNEKEELREKNFGDIIGRSLKETYARSINTSLTTLLALFAIYFFGGEATKYFALALTVGVISGAYSSIFLAAPMLILFKGKKS